MAKRKLDKITPELDAIVLGLYMSGLSWVEITERLQSKGFNVTYIQLYNYGLRRKWQEKRKQLEEFDSKFAEDQAKISKIKKVQAFALATSAMSDDIINSYIEYKANPVEFAKRVFKKEAPKPIWWVEDAYEAQALVKTEQFVLDDGKAKIENSGSVIAAVLSDEDRKMLLESMARMKENKIKETFIEGECEVVKNEQLVEHKDKE